MRRWVLGVMLCAALAGCDAPLPESGAAAFPPERVARTGYPQSLDDYRAVAVRVEPVAAAVCRARLPGGRCDFHVVVDDRPGQPPNAYQTYESSGRPVIAFTPALLAQMKNRDEIAFALSHEAAHHILGHIAQTQKSAMTGAVLGTLVGALAGLDAQGLDTAQNIGGTLGARRYSKDFELQADRLGADIALQAGYDPLRGVLFFQDAADPGNAFLGTHPPNADRIRAVRAEVGG